MDEILTDRGIEAIAILMLIVGSFYYVTLLHASLTLKGKLFYYPILIAINTFVVIAYFNN